ncbi:hypothetical protein [Roseomonas sp. KE0001]|uniref:hypothetical protein n=1 Tax=Roseomonas sp. KE0001 TaxID=2479201 RepID=UPI0018DFB409|nr:hypothetical protein [Roseomonas sp. KE0001]MBI0435421.1 hypothetical protein [Roseomonas sp. KE0001]
MTSDGITILHAKHRRLTKTWHADGTCDGYDSAKHFDLHEVVIDGLDALEALLRDLAPRWDCAVVRGAIADPARTRSVRRLAHPDPETGEAATLRDIPRRWLSLDLDGVPLPEGLDRRDLAACAAAVLPMLPEPLRQADLVVQASSSHGIKPGARLRLWGWCDRRLARSELVRWFQGTPVDAALFRPAQLNYTAAPLFAPGATDPLPARLLRIQGTSAIIQAPSAEALAPPPEPVAPVRPVSPGSGSRYALAALTRAISTISSRGEGDRHPAAVAEAWGLARLVKAGLLTESEVTRAIDGALCQAGKPKGEGAAIAAWAIRQRTDSGTLPEGMR